MGTKNRGVKNFDGDVEFLGKVLGIAFGSTLTGEPNGFVNQTDSTMSVVDGTRTLTVAPASTSYDVWVNGAPFTKPAAESVVFADTEGIHLFYFDTAGDLQTSMDINDFLADGVAQVALLYWDATGNATVFGVAEERHGLTMSSATHRYLHDVMNSRWVSGYTPGDMSVDGSGADEEDAQMSIATGSFRDEDILHAHSDGSPQDLDPIAQIPVYYRSGAGGLWRKKDADNFPMVYDGAPASYTPGNGRLAYNLDTGGTWSLAELGQLQFVNVTVFASNELAEPIIAILGQDTYSTANLARLGATTELTNLRTDGLPTVEFIPIATFILQSSTTYSNTPMARIRTTDLGDDFVDWRVRP